MFVFGKPFQPSLTIVGKAKSLPKSLTPKMGSTQVCFSLLPKHQHILITRKLRPYKVLKLGPVSNVINFFRRNYVAIGVTSVKIIGHRAASGINYAQRFFFK
jgi:hypothetical protein